MIDEILYGGITATPNDYEAPDGDLEAMVNLINEDNQLKPVGQAGEVFPLANTAQRIIFVHKGTAYKNYIILDSSNPNAPVLKYKEGEEGSIQNLTTSNACTGFRKAAAVGNILIIATEGGFLYYYFGGVSYTFLGNELPHINASFALQGGLRVDAATDQKFTFKEEVTSQQQSQQTTQQQTTQQQQQSAEPTTRTIELTRGDVERGVVEIQVLKDAYYTINCKWRQRGTDPDDPDVYFELMTYNVDYVNADGTYILWSKVYQTLVDEQCDMPIAQRDATRLMISPFWRTVPTGVNDIIVTVSVTLRQDSETQPDNWQLAKTEQNVTKAMGLANEFLAKATADNLFVCPFFLRYTIELYDGSEVQPSAPVLMIPNYKTTPLMPFVFKESPSSQTETEIPCDVFTAAVACNLAMSVAAGDDNTASLLQWQDLIRGIKVYVTPPIYTYNQAHEFKEEKDGLSIGGCLNREGFVTSESSAVKDVWNMVYAYFSTRGASPEYQILLPQKEDKAILDEFNSAHDFRLIKEIPFTDIQKYRVGENTSHIALQLDGGVLTSILQQEELKNGNQSRHTIRPTTAFTYNSRLITAAEQQTIYKGDFLPLMNGFVEPYPARESYIVDVYLAINGVEKVVRRNVGGSDFGKWCGRWFFYPDVRATKAVIYQYKQRTDEQPPSDKLYSAGFMILTLAPHPTLAGAYFFVETPGEFQPVSSLPQEYGGFPENQNHSMPTGDSTTWFSSNAEIYVSEPANPFAYDPANTIKVGSTHVISFSAATMALSENQSGRFPLYVFTNEGVWALETNSDGTFSMPSPVTRDVVLGAGESITQIDSAVLFATARGIMLLSGKSSQCISDTLINKTGFVIPAHLAALTGVEGDITSATPFLDYIQDGCRILYDYTNQRFIVFSAQYNYAYAYSLKSKKWSLMYQHITEVFNSYPEAYAQSDTIVRDYSHESDIPNVNAVPFDGIVEDAVDQMVGITNPDHIYYVTAKHMFMAERSGLYYSSWTNSEDYNDYPVARQDVVFCLTTSIGSRYKFNGADLVLTSILPQLLITRPLKLSQPNALKTVDTIIQRGVFNKTHVRSVLYGSRDLINWHIVFTSTNHILRGFRGTPYKYFRIALICDLTSTESISGCTIQWQPRQTNQPR